MTKPTEEEIEDAIREIMQHKWDEGHQVSEETVAIDIANWAIEKMDEHYKDLEHQLEVASLMVQAWEERARGLQERIADLIG